MMRALARFIRGFRADRRGVSAVEFALIAPVLIVFYFGIAELTQAMMASRRASHVASSIGDLVAQEQSVTNAEMTKVLLGEIGYMAYLEKTAKKPEEYAAWATCVDSFLAQIAAYDERNRTGGLAGFLDEISLNDDREDKEEDDIMQKKGICLITMHASKGLEFPVVYLPGCEKGIIPHKRSYEEGRVDEERRLLYVGLTRAMKKLTISYVRWRMKYGEKQAQLPSPFLEELDRTYLEEQDYGKHMKETVNAEENVSFISGLRAMLKQGKQ